jgi:hypothetical protein
MGWFGHFPAQFFFVNSGQAGTWGTDNQLAECRPLGLPAKGPGHFDD